MPTFVMLTRLSPAALQSPQSLEALEKKALAHIREACPAVEWRDNFAILGGCDYLDIFRAPDIDTAMRVSAIVRSFGHASTEVWCAAEWRHFKDLLRQLPG